MWFRFRWFVLFSLVIYAVCFWLLYRLEVKDSGRGNGIGLEHIDMKVSEGYGLCFDGKVDTGVVVVVVPCERGIVQW